MFRRSRTRPHPSQSPMKNAIEQELCATSKTKEDRPAKIKAENKEYRSEGAQKKTQRPPMRTSSRQKPSNPPSSQGRNPLNKSDKIAQNYETFITKAKEANTRGDFIQAEQYYQQADHYARLMKEKE